MSARESGGRSEHRHEAAVVVRSKRSRGEGEHHGGAWKIAYADFMTAMMAFFLVMWLVNATDEKTIVQVAAYFNPLKLTEKTPSQRGLHDGNVASVPQGGKGAPPQPSISEEHSAAATRERRRQKGQSTSAEAAEPSPEALDRLAAKAADYLAPKRPAEAPTAETKLEDPWRREPRRAAPESHTGDGPSAASRISSAATGQPAPPGPGGASVTAETLEREVRELLGRARGLSPIVEVQVTNEGVLLSLMDTRAFGMFAIASSDPRPELVVLLREIGALLAQRPGGIVVSGHTDARPFRTAVMDNWRLSTSRAHAARLMLVRGGVDDSRFERIEGRADRGLRNRTDPEAAENRRIDILLRVPA